MQMEHESYKKRTRARKNLNINLNKYWPYKTKVMSAEFQTYTKLK